MAVPEPIRPIGPGGAPPPAPRANILTHLQARVSEFANQVWANRDKIAFGGNSLFFCTAIYKRKISWIGASVLFFIAIGVLMVKKALDDDTVARQKRKKEYEAKLAELRILVPQLQDRLKAFAATIPQGIIAFANHEIAKQTYDKFVAEYEALSKDIKQLPYDEKRSWPEYGIKIFTFGEIESIERMAPPDDVALFMNPNLNKNRAQVKTQNCVKACKEVAELLTKFRDVHIPAVQQQLVGCISKLETFINSAYQDVRS